MSGTHIDFLADEEDLKQMFLRFDERTDFIYTQTLSKVNADAEQFDSALPLLGYQVTHLRPNPGNVFMITMPATELYKQVVTLNNGSGKKISLSQDLNPDAVELLLGGEAGPSTIVQSTLRTTGETGLAKEMFKILKKETIKDAKKLQGHYYVMPNALKKLHDGWRLTPGIEAPANRDIYE